MQVSPDQAQLSLVSVGLKTIENCRCCTDRELKMKLEDKLVDVGKRPRYFFYGFCLLVSLGKSKMSTFVIPSHF